MAVGQAGARARVRTLSPGPDGSRQERPTIRSVPDVDDAPPDRGTARTASTSPLSVYRPMITCCVTSPFEMEETGPRLGGVPSEAHAEPLRDVDPATLLVLTDVLGGFLVGRVIARTGWRTAQPACRTSFEHPGVGELRIERPSSGRAAARSSCPPTSLSAWPGPAGLRCRAPIDGPRRAGSSRATFVRLPRRDTTLDLLTDGPSAGRRLSLAVPGSGHDRSAPPVDRRRARGSVGLEVTPYVRNSFGAVNGGVVAALAAAAAEELRPKRGPGPGHGCGTSPSPTGPGPCRSGRRGVGVGACQRRRPGRPGLRRVRDLVCPTTTADPGSP